MSAKAELIVEGIEATGCKYWFLCDPGVVFDQKFTFTIQIDKEQQRRRK